MKRTVLVTGGAGFIGANFVYHILKKYPDYRVIVVDKLTYAGNLDNLKEAIEKFSDRFAFYREDIVERHKMLEIFVKEKPDFVAHFAAESHVDKSIENPYPFLMTNILGTHSLLEAAKFVWVDRFHLISTDEVFGELPLDDLSIKFTEESNYNPQNPYSASKAAADHLVRAYRHTYGMNITLSNCTNNIGPYQFPEKIVPWFTLNALNDRPITVHGSGHNMRDYIYVWDHCEGIDRVLHLGKSGETYFFSTERETSNIEVANIVVEKLGKPKSLINYVKDRPGNDTRYAMYYTKAKNDLGWTPEHTFEQSIEMTIDWYVKNEKWYEHSWAKLQQEYQLLNNTK